MIHYRRPPSSTFQTLNSIHEKEKNTYLSIINPPQFTPTQPQQRRDFFLNPQHTHSSSPLLFQSPLMDSQTLRQRTKDEPTTTTNNNNNSTGNGARRDKKAMAKRGLRSLAIAIGTPLSLTLTNIFLFGSGQNYHNNEKPFWYPPLWALHSACIVSSILMGLSAWLVWADGGFHKQPSVVPLYLGQLFLSLAWDPIVLKLGAGWVGLMVCVGLFGTLVACLKRFRQVNPIAGDLLKPCLAWVAYLALVNTKLLHL